MTSDAEPWRSILGSLGPWRGVVKKANPYVQDGPDLIAWQCAHRHDTEGEAVQCADDHAAGRQRRRRPSSPGRRNPSRGGRWANLLDLLGVQR